MMDKRIEAIPEGAYVLMNYPLIQLKMTGLARAIQRNTGMIELTYLDYEQESRQADFYIEDKTIFEIVSFVQEGRK
jgi:hypothetical protein